MADRIILNRIAVYAYHGVFPEEEKLGQRFFISLECRLDLRPAGEADAWSLTASYDRIADIVVKVSLGQRFHLIEALAERVASQVLEAFPAIHSVVVRVEKPAVPIPVILDNVTVEIERHRKA